MRLPISGLEVSFRLPNGYDDLAMLEAGSGASSNHRVDARGSEAQAAILERALDALSRLAKLRPSAGDSSDTTTDVPVWNSLTITDFESALLGLRRFLFGDTVRCIVRCACTERMEIEFSIAQLLREARPLTPSRVQPSTTRPGWFELSYKHNQRDDRDHLPPAHGRRPAPRAAFAEPVRASGRTLHRNRPSRPTRDRLGRACHGVHVPHRLTPHRWRLCGLRSRPQPAASRLLSRAR